MPTRSISKYQAKAIVIGAGLAGLSSAYRLQQAGFSVSVLERCRQPGGRVRTLRREGFIIDAGPDAMTSGYGEYLKLVDELGLRDQVVSSSRTIGLVRDGRVIDIDPARPVAALFSRALSWRAKLKFALGLFGLRKQMKGVDASRLIESSELDDERESAQQFGERHFGREVINYVIDPLMRLTSGSGAAQCSPLGALSGLVNWSVKLINMKTGLDLLPERLAARLDVVCSANVVSVTEAAGDGVDVRYLDADGHEQNANADVAVIATTQDVVDNICPTLRPHTAEYLEQLKWVRLISISLAYRRTTNSKAYAVQVPTLEKPDVLLIW